MKNYKNVFNQLPENEQLDLIEKVMPNSGSYRQLENREDWSEMQWKMIYDSFINSLHWYVGEVLDTVSINDRSHSISGESDLGHKYEAVGIYSNNILCDIEDLTVTENINVKDLIFKILTENTEVYINDNKKGEEYQVISFPESENVDKNYFLDELSKKIYSLIKKVKDNE